MEICVRYAEVDAMGVLHHSRYWVYFEIGRTELLRIGGMSYRQCEQAGVSLAVTKASVQYHAPARYDDDLILTTRMEKMGKVKIEHSYELRRKSDNALLTTATTTLGSINRQGKIVPIPEEIRRQW